ncbi:MAG: DUF3341 domain-containing protein [Planctomycetes bacterium]|nr:DUF3341 domain-containing protein [Planctomycetota bacterium]
MARSVSCIARSYAQAEAIVNELRSAGFANSAISALFPDKRGDRDFVHERHTKAPEGIAFGLLLGWILLGALGALIGSGTIELDVADAVADAGPLIAGLSFAAVGAAIGGMVGAAAGSRIPEFEARRHAGKVDEGNILLSIHAGTASDAMRAADICTSSGASDIGRSRESPVREPHIPL